MKSLYVMHIGKIDIESKQYAPPTKNNSQNIGLVVLGSPNSWHFFTMSNIQFSRSLCFQVSLMWRLDGMDRIILREAWNYYFVFLMGWIELFWEKDLVLNLILIYNLILILIYNLNRVWNGENLFMKIIYTLSLIMCMWI